MSLGVLVVSVNVHAEFASDAQDRRVVRKKLHEETRDAVPVRMRHRAAEHSARDAATTVCRQHGQRNFSDVTVQCHVRNADEPQATVVDSEYRVATKIDATDVRRDARGRHGPAEAQPTVQHGEREIVRD